MGVQAILAFLFRRYGRVEDDVVIKTEKWVREVVFKPEDLLVTIYNAVKDLDQLTITAFAQYTLAQLIKFTLEVIKNTGGFEEGLKAWYIPPATQNT